MASEYQFGQNYCVIGPVSERRTWVSAKNAAVEHAKTLLHGSNSQELLVVKVVARVRRATPPIEVIDVK
jgi:hypothetical protein